MKSFAYAASQNNSSYRVGLGVASGVIVQTSSGRAVFFGAPLNFGFWKHPSPSFSTGLEVVLMPDLANPQLASRGIDAIFAYHLLGGVMNFTESSDLISVVQSYDSGLSAKIKTSYASFSISDSARLSQKISGAVLNFKLGLGVRIRQYEIEADYTIYSLPAGTERIKAPLGQLSLAYWWDT